MSFFYDADLDLLKPGASSNLILNPTATPLLFQASDPEIDCLDLDQYSALVDFQEVSMNLEEMIEGVTDLLPSYLDQPQVKAEQPQYDADTNQSYADCHTLPDMAYLSASSPQSSCSVSRPSSSGSKRKRLDKESAEYKRRRMMNNLAVKKSREKAKAESRRIEEKVGILTAENEVLQKRVEQLSEEIKFLRGFFSNIKGLPDNVQLQISKSLGESS